MSFFSLVSLVLLVVGTLLIVWWSTKKNGSVSKTKKSAWHNSRNDFFEKLNRCQTLYQLNSVCHDEFLNAQYGSQWQNDVGFIGKMTEHFIALNYDQQRQQQLIEDCKTYLRDSQGLITTIRSKCF